MNIATEAAINKALERELRLGFELKRQTERAREIQAAHQAKVAAKHVDKETGMRKLASVPTWEFFRVQQKYGHGVWHDDEFLRDFKKRYPHLCTDHAPGPKRMKTVLKSG